MIKSFRSDEQTELLLKDLKKWYKEYYALELNQTDIIIASITKHWMEMRQKILSDKMDN